jgi:hypothetical protein
MKPILVVLAGLILWSAAVAQQPSDPCASLKEDRQAMESRLRDWPDLAKYRDEAAIPSRNSGRCPTPSCRHRE